MMKLRFWIGCLACLLLTGATGLAEERVQIRADFPGGNVLVNSNDGDTVHIEPDLRGGRPWFYWHFEARATQPGKVTFAFAQPFRVGVRGPAISHDVGQSWTWLGADSAEYAPLESTDQTAPKGDSFHYEFTKADQTVRFAVAIPYLSRDLEAFLKKHAGNPHLVTSVLTRSLKGRDVPLLQIGKPGPDVNALLVTARSHACESMASYVVEGFLQEAMSDSPAGAEFRKRYVLYSVPIIDLDGVEAGDQGKNRMPHDHNRDYGRTQIYPEIQAIQKLAEDHKVQYGLDVHCPALRGDVHEAFYFDGLAIPHIKENTNELANWIREERPQMVMVPLNFLKKPPAEAPVENMPFSHYFSYRDGAVMAVTLEVPYTQPNIPLDAEMARAYGVSLLKAWARTTFTRTVEESRGDGGFARLTELRNTFQQTYRRDPQLAEQQLAAYRDDANAQPLYRAEANLLMGVLRLSQKQYADALQQFDLVIDDAHATTNQRATAMVQKTLVATADPSATAEAVETALAAFERFPYPAPEQQSKVYEAAVDYYRAQQNYERALGFAQKILPVASRYDKGKALNRIAAIQDQLKQPDQAIATRREAVQVLRKQLDPVPVGVFGATMAGDLFDALSALPDATVEEKRQAIEMVLNHKTVPVALRERMTQALAELEGK